MTREEFEERLRALEVQHQEDIALVHAGHEARIRALLSLWQTTAPPAAEPQPAAVPVTVPAPPASAPPPEPAPQPRRAPNSVLYDLIEALSDLPETFDKHDIVRVLGYEPSRATLFRALLTLNEKGLITTVSTSFGGTDTTRHRKLAPGE
jgi:hypothetical protein